MKFMKILKTVNYTPHRLVLKKYIGILFMVLLYFC